MNRLSFIVLHSIVAISIAIIGFLSIPEKTYASNSFSDNARCFVRSKQEKGKVFTAKSDEAKLKITNINPAQEIKEIALYDAKTKQRVKRNYGVYKKGETISYQNLKKNKKYYLVFKLNKKSSNRCIVLSYSIHFIKDVTKHYKFYPSVKNNNVFIQLKKTSNKKAQAAKGTVSISTGGKRPLQVKLKNSKQKINLNSLKPFSNKSDKPTKIDIVFKGKINNKDVKIKHTVSIAHYNKGSIKKSLKYDKVRISLHIPKGIGPSSGKLEFKLYDQDKKREVARKSPKNTHFYDFDRKLFDGKKIRVTATFKGSKVKGFNVYTADIHETKVYHEKPQPTHTPVSNSHNSSNPSNNTKKDDKKKEDKKEDKKDNKKEDKKGDKKNDKKDDKKAMKDDNKDNKSNDPKKVEIQATSTFHDNEKLVVKTSFKKKESLKGEWTVKVGESEKTKKNENLFEFALSDLKAKNGIYPLTVSFKGKEKDQPVKGELKKNLVFIEADAIAKGNQVTAQAALKGVDEASGDWEISFDGKSSKKSTGKKVSIPFLLSDPATEKELIVTFKGKVHDQKVEGKIKKYLQLQVEEDETTTDNQSDNLSSNHDQKQLIPQGTNTNVTNHDGNVDIDQIQQTNEEESVEENDSLNNNEEDEEENQDSHEEEFVIDDSGEDPNVEIVQSDPEEEVQEEMIVTQASSNEEEVGGRLPNTATVYHIGIIAGLLLLFHGIFILWLRRKHQ